MSDWSNIDTRGNEVRMESTEVSKLFHENQNGANEKCDMGFEKKNVHAFLGLHGNIDFLFEIRTNCMFVLFFVRLGPYSYCLVALVLKA